MKNEKINYNQKVNNDCVEIVPFTGQAEMPVHEFLEKC